MADSSIITSSQSDPLPVDATSRVNGSHDQKNTYADDDSKSQPTPRKDGVSRTNPLVNGKTSIPSPTHSTRKKEPTKNNPPSSLVVTPSFKKPDVFARLTLGTLSHNNNQNKHESTKKTHSRTSSDSSSHCSNVNSQSRSPSVASTPSAPNSKTAFGSSVTKTVSRKSTSLAEPPTSIFKTPASKRNYPLSNASSMSKTSADSVSSSSSKVTRTPAITRNGRLNSTAATTNGTTATPSSRVTTKPPHSSSKSSSFQSNTQSRTHALKPPTTTGVMKKDVTKTLLRVKDSSTSSSSDKTSAASKSRALSVTPAKPQSQHQLPCVTVCPAVTRTTKPTIVSLQKDLDVCRETILSQEKLIEQGQKSMSHSIQVVSGLGVMIRYLTEQLSAFSNPILHCKLQIAVKKISDLENDILTKEKSHQIYAIQVNQKESQLLEEIEDLKREILAEKKRHSKEKDQLLDMHETETKVLEEQHSFEVKCLQERFNDLLLQLDEKDKVIENRQNDIKRMEEKIKDLESCFKQEKDKRLKGLQEKLKSSECEVHSLNSVLELKDERIRALNHRVMQMEEEVKEFPGVKQTLRVLQQRVEQLEVSLKNKNDQLSQLMDENISLQSKAENSIREKKRLSIRNEELEFALTESFMSTSSHLNNTPAVKDKRVSSATLLSNNHRHEKDLTNAQDPSSQSMIESPEAGVVMRKSRSASIPSSNHSVDPEDTPIKPFNAFYFLNSEDESMPGMSTSTPSATATVYSFDSSGKKVCNFFPKKTIAKPVCHRKVPFTPPREEFENLSNTLTPKADESSKDRSTEAVTEKSDHSNQEEEDNSTNDENMNGLIRTGTWSRKRRAKSKGRIHSPPPAVSHLEDNHNGDEDGNPDADPSHQNSMESKTMVLTSSSSGRDHEDVNHSHPSKNFGSRDRSASSSLASSATRDVCELESVEQNNQSLVNAFNSTTRLMKQTKEHPTEDERNVCHENEASTVASADSSQNQTQDGKDDASVIRQHDVHVRII